MVFPDDVDCASPSWFRHLHPTPDRPGAARAQSLCGGFYAAWLCEGGEERGERERGRERETAREKPSCVSRRARRPERPSVSQRASLRRGVLGRSRSKGDAPMDEGLHCRNCNRINTHRPDLFAADSSKSSPPSSPSSPPPPPLPPPPGRKRARGSADRTSVGSK
jgi:hypothetical protein